MREQQARALHSLDNILLIACQGQPGPALMSLAEELKACVARIRVQSVAQEKARQERSLDAQSIGRLRRDLRHKHMMPIARRAKTLFKDHAGLTPALQVPHARATIAELVEAAKEMAKAVQPHEKSFREVGFPTGFLKALRADAAALNKSSGNSDAMLQERANATAAIRSELAHGRDLARAIEAQMLAELDANPRQAKHWRAEQRIKGKTRAQERLKKPRTLHDLTPPRSPVDSLNAPATPGRFSLSARFTSRSHMFAHDRRTVVVVGAQWGDEGKGKLVDVLAERTQWVVRYKGGANAGHTVHIGESYFVLHQIPSGILHPGVRCAIGNGVVLDPETLFTEIDGLVRDQGGCRRRLYVSDRAHLVLPYHKLVDAESHASQALGTTGRGIGPAYEDKVARRGVRVHDLRHRDQLCKLVQQGVNHANAQLALFGSSKRASADETMALLDRVIVRLLPLVEDVGLMIHRAIESGAAVLLEGAQGSLLDVDHGTYPFVTSSNTTSGGAAIGAGIAPTKLDAVLGVVKAYTTRVGTGPLPTEMDETLSEQLRTLGNEFGATTGRPRRCGWFDAVVVRYASRINGLTDLAVTKLDVLDTFDRLALCTGYEYDGQVHVEFPADLTALDKVVPQYEWLDGWKSSTAGARKLEDLPKAARQYLDRIQEAGGRADHLRGRGYSPRSDHRPRIVAGDVRATPPDATEVDLLIVGAGPCGLAAAISAQRAGLRTIVLDSHTVVSTITQYPTYVHFFSTAEKLALGGLPFVVTTEKPTRRDGLAYYRAVAQYFGLTVRQYERVTAIEQQGPRFVVRSRTRSGIDRTTNAGAVVVATGYFGSPNLLGVPGEQLSHVTHTFREGHEAFQQQVVVIGGGNSAAEAALDLWRAGAQVTLTHFGPTFDKKIKPWVLPDFENRAKEGSIGVRWNSRVLAIEPDAVRIATPTGEERLPASIVYALTGYAPNVDLLRAAGVPIDATTGIPAHDPNTLETTVPGLFIAGVVTAGFDANKVFIENGRYHGDRVVARLLGRPTPEAPRLSAELDS